LNKKNGSDEEMLIEEEEEKHHNLKPLQDQIAELCQQVISMTERLEQKEDK
jgi:hypothetical protein